MKRSQKRMDFPAFSGKVKIFHWAPPIFLILLFLSVLIWLPWQTQRTEANERQSQLIADTLWVEQAIRFQFNRNEDTLRTVGQQIEAGTLAPHGLRETVSVLMRSNRELIRLVLLDKDDTLLASTVDAPFSIGGLSAASKLAAERARILKTPLYGQPSLSPEGKPPVTMDYHFPLYRGEHYIGSLIATYDTAIILDDMAPWWFAQDNEIVLADQNDTVIGKRTAGGPGRNVYTYSRVLDLPGTNMTLRTNSVKEAPNLLSNSLVTSIIALSIGLLWSLWALWRDINRRLATEEALLHEIAFRKAMENSLITGLRARDMEGRVTYVNPAFSAMVGYPEQELVGKMPPMPYWAPEAMSDYQERLVQRQEGTLTAQGFETIFQHAGGQRLPVLVFESPLVDESGQQTGWMGSVLNISEQKAVEEINRQQREKLQFSARLSSMGEIASTLAHELNQPLAAISSYTTGALNMLNGSIADNRRIDPALLKTALENASVQAQRAGQIIRSVHTFVKQREPLRQPVSIQEMIESVIPLVTLQANPSFVSTHFHVAPDLPIVLADKMLLEQVLLNLTRNAIEAMQGGRPERRLLEITAVREEADRIARVVVSVSDRGTGISAEVAERLFSPFFSTKSEGMGMGLKICRTAIEFHGGTLVWSAHPEGGTIFRFSLPAL